MQIEQLKACDEIASSRTSNWQAFCLEERSKRHHEESEMLCLNCSILFIILLSFPPLLSTPPSIFRLSFLLSPPSPSFLSPFLLIFSSHVLLLFSAVSFTSSFSLLSILFLLSLLTPLLFPTSSLAATLPYLFQASFFLDEGLAPLILQLIHTALSGVPPKAEETKESAPSKKEGKDKEERQEKEDSGGKEKTKKETEKEESKLTSPVPGVLLRSIRNTSHITVICTHLYFECKSISPIHTRTHTRTHTM